MECDCLRRDGAGRVRDGDRFRLGEKARRGVRRKEVAFYLGNTPTVARNSYIDPRVFDRFRSGWTISGVLEDVGDVSADELSIEAHVESAVLDLLAENTASDTIERVEEIAGLAS